MKNDANIRNFIEISGNMHGKSRKMHENRGISEESIPRSGRTEGRSCGRFRSFPLVIRTSFRSFPVISGHFPIDSSKSFLFIPFRSSFLPKNTENSPKS